MKPTPSTLFHLLIHLYPRSYRARYGVEMEAFHRQELAAGASGVVFWVSLVGDHVQAAARVRWGGGDGMMLNLWEDLKGGAKALRRAGVFTLFAVVTLGLGIGATTAVFSVVDRVVLRPLPYPDSERMALVGIRSRMDPESRGPLSTPMMLALASDPGPAEAIVAASGREMVFDAGGDVERMVVTRVSDGFFPFFGAEAHAGRLLTDADQAPGSERTAVLGYDMWLERYGADPDAIGRTIRIDDDIYTVVGVISRDFVPPPEVADANEVWIPLRLREADPEAGSFFMVGVARLRPGATVAEMEARVAQVVDEVYPPGDGPNFVTGGAASLFHTEVVGHISGALGKVLAAVVLLLLIACVNVGSLLLTRGNERRHELSVRAALGAGRIRLLRQLLAESLVLAAAGGALGSAIAFGSVELFRTYAPAGLPRLAEVAVDGRGLAFAMTLAAGTVMLFGLLPAMRGARRAGAVTHLSRRASPGRREGHLQGALVAVETALAVVLAVGSGLLAKDLGSMTTQDHGMEAEGVASMRLSLNPRYERSEWVGIWQQFLAGAEGLPGVTSAALSSQVPFTGNRTAATFRPEGAQGEDAKGAFSIVVSLGGDYVGTLSAQLTEGRAFGPGDDGSAPVALVNGTFARRFWPGENAVGKLVQSGSEGVEDEPTYQIVGVLADVTSRVDRDEQPTLYLPLQEQPTWDMEVMVRTSGDAAAMGGALRELARTIDPALPVTNVRTVESLNRTALARPRFYATLFGGFAGIALLLAIVGVYGTTAYAARSRLREIGIRMALGARSRQVVTDVVGRSTLAVCGGIIVGLAGAALASRAMVDVLHQVDPRDVAAYATVGVLVLAAGIIAAWVPAGRAGRVDPAQTLRQDG